MIPRSTFASTVALALTVAGTAFAQGATQRINGRIIDNDTKQPIPAVAVTVTGTTIGATTNDSGRFTLRNVPADARTLTTRRIGYRGTTAALVAGQDEYTIGLTKDVLQLEQQVITGVATTQSERTAATFNPVVTSEQLNAAPTPTIENALQGKIPGADIQQNSGAPGGGLQISIRGVTSIYGNSDPLYVVDGTIVTNYVFASGLNALTAAGSQYGNGNPGNQDQSVNRIADINPNDIESIQVLSGAAAASIYGSRAAGGVIVITTKKGTAGKPQVDVSQKVGTFNLANKLDVRRFTLAQAEAQGTGMGLTTAQVDANYAACHGFCDQQGSLYGGGQLSYQTDVAVRGGITPQAGAGANVTTYYVSASTKYDNGAQLNTGYHKQSVRANVSQTLFNTVTVNANVTYTSSLTSRGLNGNDNLGISGYDVLAYTPSWFCMACHDATGNYVVNPSGVANGFDDAARGRTPEEINRTILGGNVAWKLFTSEHQSFELVGQGGADFANQRDQFYLPPDLQVEQSPLVSLPGVSTSQSGYARLSNWSISAVHKYTSATGLLTATTSLGVTRDKTTTFQTNNTGQNLISGLPSFVYGAVQIPYNRQEESNNQGFLGQEELVLFSERLSLTGGINAERSSNNGGINRYYIYPKAAVSLRPIVGNTELKLRFAYGQSGNLPIYGVKFNEGTLVTYNGITGLGFSQVAGDPHVRPETNTTMETGADLTLFSGRMSLSGTVYQKRLTNLLLFSNVLPSSGFNQAWLNGGQITNQGLELSLSATPIQAGQFSWVSTETFSRNYARVDALPIPAFSAGQFFGYFPFGGYRIQVGADPNAIWGYQAATGRSKLVQIGNSAPAFIFAFGQDVAYGPVHVHALFDWRKGQSAVDLTQDYFDAYNNLADTAGRNKRVALQGAGLTAYTQHASFLKLREATLRVELPGFAVRSLGRGYLRNAAISLTGRNLITWTNYPGLDPEVSNFGNQQFGRGQDVTPYPPTRSYFLSLDLGF